jgi:Cu/Zn superoxide dismutase
MGSIRKHAAAVTIGVSVLAVSTGVALAASAWSTGPDHTYGTANPFAGARASVHVVANGSGGSTVSLQVKGVDADAGRTFGAHVHRAPCGQDPLAAGGHYQHAGAVGDLEDRELWLDVTVNGGGNGTSVAHRPWAVDQSTLRSVVIHALPTNAADGTAGARLACIDLDG